MTYSTTRREPAVPNRRSERMRRQAANLAKAAAQVQDRSTAAEEVLTRLEDRDARRTQRFDRDARRLPGR